MRIGNWQLEILDGGTFSIDGGAAFGVVPKTVWRRVFPCDEHNRVRFACNCLLARDGKHVVLIDTGYGGKYPPLDRKSYQMDAGCPIITSLEKHGVSPEEVDYVLFTHLHFDHAGGATTKEPDGRLVPTFPNAKHLVSQWEWEDATGGSEELIAAYPQNNLTPLAQAGVIESIDFNQAILPGLRALRTGGHTRGHTAFLFQSDEGDQGALYIGDLCPTSSHLRLLWNMSYDMFLLVTRRKKREMLSLAVQNHWWLIFPHDPDTIACRIRADNRQDYLITEAERRLIPSSP